jgi:ABC-type sugar transport system ATPase subunit
MTEIELHGVSKVFGTGITAVEQVSLRIAAGEWLCLLGPSGCGKTTLVRLIAGLEVPTSGNLFLNGCDAARLAPHQRRVALARQEAALYPQRTVAGNLDFGAPRNESHRREVIEGLELEALLQAYPGQLSGGQRQRVALGRALLRGASILLLDEPLAQLDPAGRAKIRARLPLLRGTPAPTIVHVTHDLDEAQCLADRVALLECGRLQCAGPVAEILPRRGTLPADTFPGVDWGRPDDPSGRVGQ